MLKSRIFTLALLTAVSGCSTVGPDRAGLAGALGVEPGRVSEPRCRGYVEEPTEFSCRFRSLDDSGRWVTRDVTVAIDGSNWIVIGGF